MDSYLFLKTLLPLANIAVMVFKFD